MKLSLCTLCLFLIACVQDVYGYAFVCPSSMGRDFGGSNRSMMFSRQHHQSSQKSSTSHQMVDQNVIMGAGIAVAGLAAGIGLVAFTEAQGERAKSRGGGLSESMSTRIAGGLLEDVEVSSVEDLGSLTNQLEQALKQSGGAKDDEFVMTDEEKKRIADQADDGW